MFSAMILKNLLRKIRYNKYVLMVFVFVVLFQFLVLHGIPVVYVGELYFAIQVSKGYVIYRDLMNPHAPGVYYLGGLIFSFFKPSYLLIELINYIVFGLVGVLVYKISENIMSKRASFFSVVAFIVVGRAWEAQLFYPDIYAILFTTLAMYISLKYKENWKIDFIVGIIFAISIAFKQNIGAFGLLSIILYITIINIKNKNILNVFRRSINFALGVGIVFFLIGFYFYLNNALPQMYYQMFAFTLKGFATTYSAPCSPTTPATFIIEVGVIGLALSMYRAKDNESSCLLLLSLWSLISILVAYPACYARYLVPSVVPFSILLMYTLTHLYKTPVLSDIKTVFPARYKLLMLLFLVITIPVTAIFSSEIYRHYTVIENMKSSPPSYWYSWIDYTQTNNSDVVNFLKANTGEDDKIFSIPTDYSLYINTERGTIPSWQGNELFMQRFQEITVNDLERENLKYIVILKNVESPYPCFPTVYQYINQKYHFLINFNDTVLLERNNEGISTEQGTISLCPQNYYTYGINVTDNTIKLSTGNPPESEGYYSRLLKKFLNLRKQ